MAPRVSAAQGVSPTLQHPQEAVRAYDYRYPENLRSAVLDSP
jgi:hypothetical protein